MSCSAGPITLQGTNCKIRLERAGHFADVDEEVVKDLLGNKGVRNFRDARLITINDGPLKQDIPIKTETARREVPERFKPQREKANSGGELIPENKEAVVEEVSKTKTMKTSGSSAKVEKVEKAQKAK